MKAKIILTFILVFALASFVSAQENYCVDTDGRNPFVSGVTTLYSSSGEIIEQKSDVCGMSATVQEYWCDENGEIVGNLYSCTTQSSDRSLHGCIEGACNDNLIKPEIFMDAKTDKTEYFDGQDNSRVKIFTLLPSYLMDCDQYFVSPSGEEIWFAKGGCWGSGWNSEMGYNIPLSEYGLWKIKLDLKDNSQFGKRTFTIYTNEFKFISNLKPDEESGPVEIPKEEDDSLVSEDYFVCNGCVFENKCYYYGFRKEGKFCSDSDSQFIKQKQADSSCENSFECSSNVCVSSQCVSEGLLQKILNWFKRLFGAD